MVVLAASLCTASGKVLVSRQFVEVPRTRIEGLLSAFPKLTASGSQHTTIETENIRYVYQPLDNLFLILLTNRQSNILQDIETLRLMGRVFSKICHSTEEDKVIENSFELLSAFDEIISLGYREAVTLAQITNTIEMESHEERIQDIIAKNKEKEAKELMKEKIKLMDEQRKRDALANRERPSLPSSSSSSSYRPIKQDISVSKPTSYEPAKKKSSGSGMKLGLKSKANKVISSIQPEIEASNHYEHEEQSYENQEAIHFQFEEKVFAQLSRDGGVHNFDLRGELTINVHDEQYSFIKANLDVPNQSGYQFMTNPKMDKNLFNGGDYVLALKDQNKGFPINQSVGILKWKSSGKIVNNLPFSVTCWVSPSNDDLCDVTIEVKKEDDSVEIDGLTFSIPINDGNEPELGEYHGDYNFSDDGYLVWQLPSLNEEQKECQLEFHSTSNDQGESFFPISISFNSNQLISGLNISQVVSIDDLDSFIFSQETIMYAEDCSVV